MAATTITTTTNITHQIEVDHKKTLTQPHNPPSDLNLTHSTEGRPSAADTTSASASLPASTEAAKKDSGYQTKTDSGAVTAAAGGDNSGPVTDIQRKIRRAERFGTPVLLSEEEKRNSRAERFGTASALPSSDLLKKSEEQKRKARAERFGTAKSSQVDEEPKMKARLARFAPYSKGDSVEEDKKKARALRFAQPMSSSLTHVNGKGDVEQKSTVAGKAGGT